MPLAAIKCNFSHETLIFSIDIRVSGKTDAGEEVAECVLVLLRNVVDELRLRDATLGCDRVLVVADRLHHTRTVLQHLRVGVLVHHVRNVLQQRLQVLSRQTRNKLKWPIAGSEAGVTCLVLTLS